MASYFSQAVQVLHELGIRLPPDTTAANVLERIAVAGHAILMARGKGGLANGPDDEEDGLGPPTGQRVPGGASEPHYLSTLSPARRNDIQRRAARMGRERGPRPRDTAPAPLDLAASIAARAAAASGDMAAGLRQRGH